VDIGHDTSEQDQNSLNANIQFSESLGAKVVKLKGKEVSTATAEFVRDKHVTQVIFGRSAVEGWRKYLYMTAIHRFLRDAPAVDVHIVTQEAD
jgi:two-component system sensor histidine kinase KdpD